MASNYGNHFGVRHWDEDNASREGRYKTPKTGSELLLGTAVQIDFDNPGRLKQAAAGVEMVEAVSGLLIFEDQFLRVGPVGSINASVRQDTGFLAYATRDKYAVIGGGKGAKFWFKNVPQRTLPDGYVFPAIEIVAGLGPDYGSTVQLGDYLGWDGTHWVTVGTKADALSSHAGAWFQVVTLNDAAASLEATLVR